MGDAGDPQHVCGDLGLHWWTHESRLTGFCQCGLLPGRLFFSPDTCNCGAQWPPWASTDRPDVGRDARGGLPLSSMAQGATRPAGFGPPHRGDPMSLALLTRPKRSTRSDPVQVFAHERYGFPFRVGYDRHRGVWTGLFAIRDDTGRPTGAEVRGWLVRGHGRRKAERWVTIDEPHMLVDLLERPAVGPRAG